ncbi:TetR/AcrR family transcriptional regulator [Shewanella canadensis]|uniref:TetR/AcrR family transcriptional regulator n=1 Tax=Shewanella canadensis TaxID=271096 RepID=A0A431WPB5_9GAMM|nr:TetR/AcrR family transcriptional regulator [Shewanella canadensis]RTR37261.1 TetR/AcrR family transcriptional regulator [Shewanella canadensis]
MTNKLGRPIGDSNVRQLLLEAARLLFCQFPYEKVSTRKIAEQAGVSAALIQYYFNNKFGLFEAMIIENFEPVTKKALQAKNNGDFDSICEVLRFYYKTMAEKPEYARLVFNLFTPNNGGGKRLLSPRIIKAIWAPGKTLLFEGVINDVGPSAKVNADMFRLSFLSLMVFPFLAPDILLKSHKITLNPDFFDQLAKHNLSMLRSSIGLAPKVPHVSSECCSNHKIQNR